MSELREILWHNFQDGCTAEDVKDAEEVIMEWHKAELERVIGDDEKVPHPAVLGHAKDVPRSSRNKLRAEQRKRA